MFLHFNSCYFVSELFFPVFSILHKIFLLCTRTNVFLYLSKVLIVLAAYTDSTSPSAIFSGDSAGFGCATEGAKPSAPVAMAMEISHCKEKTSRLSFMVEEERLRRMNYLKWTQWSYGGDLLDYGII